MSTMYVEQKHIILPFSGLMLKVIAKITYPKWHLIPNCLSQRKVIQEPD